MRKFLLALLLLFPLSAHAAPQMARPQLISVYFYADWCSNCKTLSPKFSEARTKGLLDKKDILFVTLNLTDKTAIHQSILLAQGLGIGKYLKQQGSATGYVAILDANTKKELARFDSAASPDDILKAYETRLK